MATPTPTPPKKPPAPEKLLPDLLRTWKEHGDLSDEQMQQAIDYLEGQAGRIGATSANGAFDLSGAVTLGADGKPLPGCETGRLGEGGKPIMVTWNALPCSDNKPVRLNGQRFLGPMTAAYDVYHEWLIAWQGDWIAAMEFFKPRGGAFVNGRATNVVAPMFTPPRVDVRRAS